MLENIVAQTYRLTGEHLWIARIYSSFFWVIAGLALFLLIREFASTSAAMIGTLFYLFVAFRSDCQPGFHARSFDGVPDHFHAVGAFPLAEYCQLEMGDPVWDLCRRSAVCQEPVELHYRGRVCRGHPGGKRPETLHPRPAGLDNGRAVGPAGRYLHALRDVETEHGRTICLALLPQNVDRSGFLFSLGFYG